MSIIIQNMKGDAFGVCTYQLRINQKVIAEFEHNRPDGLAVCLREAASAAGKAQWGELKTLLQWERKMCDES